MLFCNFQRVLNMLLGVKQPLGVAFSHIFALISLLSSKKAKEFQTTVKKQILMRKQGVQLLFASQNIPTLSFIQYKCYPSK